MLKDQLLSVQENVKRACQTAGRNLSDVTLIAVSKTKPIEMLQEIYDEGIRDFGENKVQELIEKYEIMPKDIRWHLIGHLQTNKVKYIVDKVYMIHGVDSLKLAKEISKEAMKHQTKVNILIQVNIAKEDSKYGVYEENAVQLVEDVAKLPGIMIRGLMTIAPYVENAEENRQFFEKMKQLSVDIIHKNIDNVSMDCISMGMTGDYMIAIEEGTTCIRVGTAIFGERNYHIENMITKSRENKES